jgi:hypothetical protein
LGFVVWPAVSVGQVLGETMEQKYKLVLSYLESRVQTIQQKKRVLDQELQAVSNLIMLMHMKEGEEETEQ